MMCKRHDQAHKPLKQQTSTQNKTVVQSCGTGDFDTRSHLLRSTKNNTLEHPNVGPKNQPLGIVFIKTSGLKRMKKF